MKTKIISITLAAVLMVSTAGVFAGSQDPMIRLAQMGENVLHLYMDSLDQAGKFTIYDELRHTLYAESWEEMLDYKKRFDLSKLPDGDYSFEIEHAQKITIYSFAVTDHRVIISPDVLERYVPTIVFKDDLLGISLLNPQASDVEITITDTSGEQLINDVLAEKQLVTIRYNLTQLPVGNYTVKVKTEGRTYYQKVLR